MTEPRPAPVRRGRPSGAPVYVIAAALFLVLLTFLAVQMRAGRDPMVPAVQAATPAPKRVLVKRIERRVIITTITPAPVVGGAAPASGGGGAVLASAPATSAPAVAAALAPAPAAPAPVVTRAS